MKFGVAKCPTIDFQLDFGINCIHNEFSWPSSWIVCNFLASCGTSFERSEPGTSGLEKTAPSGELEFFYRSN